MRLYGFQRLFFVVAVLGVLLISYNNNAMFGRPILGHVPDPGPAGIRILLFAQVLLAALALFACFYAIKVWSGEKKVLIGFVLGTFAFSMLLFWGAVLGLYSIEIHSAMPIRNFIENHFWFLAGATALFMGMHVVIEMKQFSA